MRYLAVVVGQPWLCLLAYFGQVSEDMHVEDAAPEASVKALDEAVLHRPSGFDEVELDAFSFRSFRQRKSDEFRTVVQAKLRQIAAPRGDTFERSDDSRCRKIKVDFHSERLAAEVVNDVERTKPAAVPERFGHEVDGQLPLIDSPATSGSG